LQPDMMHGVTEAVMEALPEPHWHTVSVRSQWAAGMAVAKQACCEQHQHSRRGLVQGLTAQTGMSAALTAAAARERGARERMERMRNFMITD
jgi:formylmethanofuran dehydrogenase subunit E-like metal-binding protein